MEPEPGADDGAGKDGESVFGPWDELEGSLEAAKRRAELLSGFERGGVWDGCQPGPELAAALAEAAGPGWRCGPATGHHVIGLLRGMAAMQSWSGAGLLGLLRTLIRDDEPPFDRRPRHGDLPDGWDESLTHEVALALAVSAPSAEKMLRAAWELGARLPGVDLLLAAGTLDLPRARLVAEVFQDLSDENAAKAEELLLPHLTTGPRKTYTQVERLATAIAAEVDPELAERRRAAAEKHRARVTMFREQSGAAALSGRDLPTDQTLAAFAHVNARARQYKESGAFPDERMDRLRAQAYLDILNAISAEDRIAYGQLAPADAAPDPDPDATADDAARDEGGFPDDEPGDDGPDDDGPGGGPGDGPGDDGPREGPDHGPDQGLGPAGSDCPCRECDGTCVPPDDGDPPDDDEPDDHEPDDHEPDDHEPEGGRGADGPDGETKPALTDLVLPLATLLGLAERPGEGHGLGAFDPVLCRALAATAILSPDTTVCLTVTDHEGIAIGHGCAKPSHATARAGLDARPARPPDGPAPPLFALPARISLTITAAHLARLCAPPGTTGPPGAGALTGWALAHGVAPDRRVRRRPGDPGWCGPWTLTLPTGRELTVTIGPVPTHSCDHRNESHAYKPNDTLRHLVQVRDHTCTFPTCNRHARESDFEHAVPYDQGGRTCACNAGARSRQCHRVKQSPGWDVTQPRPGWHQWTTPHGWTYTQGPKRYPV